MKVKDWVVWNTEAKTIVSFGNEEDMKNAAKLLNTAHQTDANVAEPFRGLSS